MIEIFLIAETQVKPDFLNLAEKVLRRNIGLQLDRRNIPFGDIASLISVLGEAHAEGSDPIETQRDAGSLLQHASLSFLVVASDRALYEVATETSLHLVTCEMEAGSVYQVAVVSGTLQELRTEIVNGCSMQATQGMRYFSTKLLACMDKMGLERLFDLYRRRRREDGTLLLTYKN